MNPPLWESPRGRSLDRRFGIVSVDYPTQRRTAKASAHFLRDVVRNNALPR